MNTAVSECNLHAACCLSATYRTATEEQRKKCSQLIANQDLAVNHRRTTESHSAINQIELGDDGSSTVTGEGKTDLSLGQERRSEREILPQ